ncbi:hypothetical protein [Kangiella sp.]|uniref:hypothetical protein n=1 Tax=Kangiella sp. TaxID=1920245 RepID=UPI003A8CAD6D
MPKKIDYPHASVAKSIELAESVYDLGGSSSQEMCAENMGRKVGGGFKAIVSAAAKFGLITNNRGQLSTTKLFQDYYLGYSQEEKAEILRKAFLRVSLFQEIYERFKHQKLPIDIFDKLLIREFDVNQQVASRVAKYFIEGAKATKLLNGDNTFHLVSDEANSSKVQEVGDEAESADKQVQEDVSKESVASNEFSIRIAGPGMNSTIVIREEEDLDIVEVMLKKVRKKLLEAQE